jgi:phage-related protein
VIVTLLGVAVSSPPGITIYAMDGVTGFIEDISDQNDVDAVDVMLKRVVEHGLPRNKDKCSTLGDGIFELKPYGVRLVFFHHPSRRWTIVITHGFKKQGQKTPPREIRFAKDQQKLFDTALSKGSVTYDDMA